MALLRFAVLLTVAVALLRSEDISARVRRVLAPWGNGEQAASGLAEKDYATVEQILATTRATSPQARAELLSARGAVAFLAGKMNDAVTDFDQASAIWPLSDGDRFTLAMALVKLSDGGRASRQLELLADRHPDQSLYLYWLGKLDYDQRRYEDAVVKLERAAGLDPKSARIWDSLGLAFDMQGQSEQAQHAFEKAVELNRSGPHPSPWPPHNLGVLWLRLDRPLEAASAFRDSLHYDSEFAPAHYHLGRALEKQGQEIEAVGEYSKAISLDKTSTDACYSLALLYRKLNRPDQAEATFAEYRKRKQALAASDTAKP